MSDVLTREEYAAALIEIQSDVPLPRFKAAHTKIMRHEAAMRAEVERLGLQRAEDVIAAESRVAALTEIIEKAPHAILCAAAPNVLRRHGHRFVCNCWKRAALEREEKK